MPDNKKRGLGRGLDLILESPETDITSRDISGDYVAGAVAEIDINLIEANPFQPRTEFDETALEELAQSIKEQGVIQPVTVRKLGYNRYQLISGERRLRASKLAGLSKIPVFIRIANDEQMLELALIENIHRENLNALEVGEKPLHHRQFPSSAKASSRDPDRLARRSHLHGTCSRLDQHRG